MSNGLLPGVPDLRSRVMRGLVWVGASQAGGVVTRAIVAIFIARLLTPDEYGLAALALVFASLVMVFSDLALGAALIQRKTLSAVDKDTAFWTTMGAGVIFTVLGAALSGPIASLYGQPDAQPLLLVLSLSFLVSALGATQQNLMLREMDFKRVEVLPMIAALFGGFAAVIAAFYGAGAWAIIVQQVVTVIMTTILVWMRSEWRPRFAFSGASLRDLGGFSAYMLGQRILWYVQVNGDRFLIGRFLGTSALGIYAVAYNTMLVPASKLGGPLQRVFSPAFSRIQDEPARIAATWARVARLLAFVTVPALGGLVVVAPDFVPLVLGSHWEAAVPVVQILAWVGIVQAIQVINMDILLARGRSRTMFRLAIVVTSAHMVAFVVGLQWGIIGVSVAVRDLDHPLRAALDVPGRPRAARVADGLLQGDLRRLPGGRRYVPRSPRAAGRARRRGCRPAGSARALHPRRCRRLRAALPVARARAEGRGARPAGAPRGPLWRARSGHRQELTTHPISG